VVYLFRGAAGSIPATDIIFIFFKFFGVTMIVENLNYLPTSVGNYFKSYAEFEANIVVPAISVSSDTNSALHEIIHDWSPASVSLSRPSNSGGRGPIISAGGGP